MNAGPAQRAILDPRASNDDNDRIEIAARDETLASLTIRNLEPSLKERLRVRAAYRGHSMEAEARAILESALADPDRRDGRSLFERIHGRFVALGGVDLDLPPRDAGRPPPEFE